MKACASANFSCVSRSCASSSRTRSTSAFRDNSVSAASEASDDSIAQDLPKVAGQRIDVDIFHRHAQSVVPILARPPLRRSDLLPVGSLIEGAAKAVPFDKRLDQRDSMPVLRLPIRRESPQHPPQHPTAQPMNSHP